MLEVADCVIDTSRRGNVSRFFNHHCHPNIQVRQVVPTPVGVGATAELLPFFCVGFYTLRAVKAGEELCCETSLTLPPPLSLLSLSFLCVTFEPDLGPRAIL